MPSEEDLQKFTALLSLAQRTGGSMSINISVPVSTDQDLPPQPNQPVKEKATARTMMWVLNRLKGAPGQPHRELVRKFLFIRGWIGPTDEPEQWNLDFVPTSSSELSLLGSQLIQFERDGKAPA